MTSDEVLEALVKEALDDMGNCKKAQCHSLGTVQLQPYGPRWVECKFCKKEWRESVTVPDHMPSVSCVGKTNCGCPNRATPITDDVNHPAHYTRGKFEVIDVIEDWNLGFHLGNVVKYIARADHKGNKIKDLQKAAFYLKREIARLEKLMKTEITANLERSLANAEKIKPGEPGSILQPSTTVEFKIDPPAVAPTPPKTTPMSAPKTNVQICECEHEFISHHAMTGCVASITHRDKAGNFTGSSTCRCVGFHEKFPPVAAPVTPSTPAPITPTPRFKYKTDKCGNCFHYRESHDIACSGTFCPCKSFVEPA